MKDFLSKKHYCHNVHTILIKSSAYLLPTPYVVYHPLSFLHKSMGLTMKTHQYLCTFTKFSFLTNKKFSKKDCLEYHYCLITIIIIIIVIIIIITMTIMVIMIIILIVIINMTLMLKIPKKILFQFLKKYNTANIVNDKTCFKSLDNSSCIDLFITS